MASKKFEKGTKEWSFFSDLWQMAQSVWVPENNDKYFEDALSLISAFDQKYNTPYSHYFSQALLSTLTEFSIEKGFEQGKIWEGTYKHTTEEV